MTAIYDHALAAGIFRGLLVAAGIMLLAVAIATAAIRTGREHPINPRKQSRGARAGRHDSHPVALDAGRG